MSASLVGSEMCIRDRELASNNTSIAAYATACLAYNEHCARVLRCGRAVSYTHLTLPTICSV
eukprot:14147220-Alexandrium_andersonii.AAC.1